MENAHKLADWAKGREVEMRQGHATELLSELSWIDLRLVAERLKKEVKKQTMQAYVAALAPVLGTHWAGLRHALCQESETAVAEWLEEL